MESLILEILKFIFNEIREGEVQMIIEGNEKEKAAMAEFHKGNRQE